MTTKWKQLACETIQSRASDLNKISQEIWSHPELNFEEYFAHELLTSFLEKEGFQVAKKTPIETSFIAKYGKNDGLKIGIICEYDALPGVGHACGHNLIAEAGIAAALGVKEVLSKDASINAQLIVYGTPAEEGGGGKCMMIEKGVFDEVDICMMSHPTPYEIPTPMWLGVAIVDLIFHGKASHAAAAPWEGINALDAAVACYNNISMLRQQTKPTNRIHGIITDGGKKPNIIPERSALRYFVRGISDADVSSLRDQLVRCAEGAAKATGCTVEAKYGIALSPVKTNQILIDLYVANARTLGVEFNNTDSSVMMASTDMGNVSQIKPSIHPLFRIKTDGANHTHDFTKATGSEENQLATLNSGKSMAMTAIDVIYNASLIKDISNDFDKNI